jgi:superfamily II DNA or RNA helicase
MARFPNAYHIGLSATPERLDGTGLNAHFDEMVCGPTVRELIDAGWLSDYVLYRPSEIDLSNVHTLGGEYNKKDLAKAIAKSRVVGDALTHYRKYCPGARGIAFCVSIEESIKTVAAFNAAGIPAEHVDGGTDDTTRDNAIQNFKAGKTLLLSNVNLFSEGFDVPAVEAVFDLAPTKSLAMYLQRCGRALRPAEGKTQALLFDHAANSKMHGMPDADRAWTLAGREKRARGGVPEPRRCGLCFACVSPSATVCRHCGYKFPVQAREIEQVEGELSPVERQRQDAMVKDQRLAESVEDLEIVGRMRGYKDPKKWAMHVWKGRAAKRAGDEARAWAAAGW